MGVKALFEHIKPQLKHVDIFVDCRDLIVVGAAAFRQRGFGGKDDIGIYPRAVRRVDGAPAARQRVPDLGGLRRERG